MLLHFDIGRDLGIRLLTSIQILGVGFTLGGLENCTYLIDCSDKAEYGRVPVMCVIESSFRDEGGLSRLGGPGLSFLLFCP